MELEGGFDDEEPVARWLPPDDRLWRHPSEVMAHPLPAGTAPSTDREPRLWLVAVLGGLIGSLLTAGLIAAAGGFDGGDTVVRPTVRQASTPVEVRSVPASDSGTTVVEIAERVRPAIVQIDVEAGVDEGSGSGVIFRSDGYVLTNHHVVEEADSITVVMADGKEHDADVVGGDEDTDIAVVKIAGADLPTAVLGSASALKVGHQAIAIGSPLGLAGGPSLSVGVVSALGRQVESRDGPPLLDMIQTDAPIAPGSSGGALLDGSGAVIGVTTAIAVSEVGAEGLGFATPIDIARDVADQIIATGQVVHVWLGIEGEDLDDQRAGELGIESGAVVRRVRSGSPADDAGMEPSDVIVSIDGKPVTGMGALVVALRSRRPGETVSIGVARDDGSHTLEATLIERPDKL